MFGLETSVCVRGACTWMHVPHILCPSRSVVTQRGTPFYMSLQWFPFQGPVSCPADVLTREKQNCKNSKIAHNIVTETREIKSFARCQFM